MWRQAPHVSLCTPHVSLSFLFLSPPLLPYLILPATLPPPSLLAAGGPPQTPHSALGSSPPPPPTARKAPAPPSPAAHWAPRCCRLLRQGRRSRQRAGPATSTPRSLPRPGRRGLVPSGTATESGGGDRGARGGRRRDVREGIGENSGLYSSKP
ncbi:hypothetical protein PVAP13_3KG543850 [Panicum virgatum]|uniref:Uncharacterized protein n=1 Tax=Panicum virgatum TaxID=38727 RepID=A0A8T0V2R7_PANVG|nr:hypothetical protein PVAP13_3KG543850 [Panicum virgatum]